jgi:hypothetical protein
MVKSAKVDVLDWNSHGPHTVTPEDGHLPTSQGATSYKTIPLLRSLSQCLLFLQSVKTTLVVI